MPKNLNTYKKFIFLGLFVFAFSLILTRAYLISMNDPQDGRSSIRGDAYSDINTYSAVKYFYDFGFWKSKLRPMHGYIGSALGNPSAEDIKLAEKATAYTHYPALPDVLVGVWSHLIHSTNEFELRLFPILLSVLFFFFIFLFLKKFLPDPNAAWIGFCVIVLSNYFLAWSDNLHKHTFEEISKWVFVWFLLSYFQKQKPIRYLYLLFFMAIAIGNFSFEPIVFLAFSTVGLSFIYEKNWFKKLFNSLNIFVGLGFVFSFVLHFYFNALYFSDFQAAIEDLKVAFLYRTNQCTDPSCNLAGLDYLQLPLIFVNRIERFFVLPGFAFIYLFWLARKKWLVSSPKTLQVAYVLLASSFAWMMVMSQHAHTHAFTGKQIGILIAWVSGTGLIEYWNQFQTHLKARKKIQLAFHFLFIFYMVGMFLTQQVGPIYWLHGFSRWFTAGL